MKKEKVLLGITTTILAGLLMTGCGKTEKEKVSLSVWGSAESQKLLTKMADEFKKKYEDTADIQITISAESEMTCRETVLANPESAADVYTFAGDQFSSLVENNALLEITDNTDSIMEANGGKDSAAIEAASSDGKLYAYPMTASNGYFMYYDKSYFSEEDVKSLDKMLEIAAENKKKIAMDFSSGWYIYSFFKGAGLNVELDESGKSNVCDWNSTENTYTGLDVAEAMLAFVNSKGSITCDDGSFVSGAEDGTIIAGVNGTWNAAKIEKAYGDNYAATKLPTYTIKGDQVQMHSFAGYKLVGVNSHTKNAKWAMRFAEWITNEKNQIKRFKESGEGPSNVKAGNSEEVLAAPAISALSTQSEFAHIQNVASTFWTPTQIFGTTIAAGNLDKKTTQELLDQMVEGITANPDSE